MGAAAIGQWYFCWCDWCWEQLLCYNIWWNHGSSGCWNCVRYILYILFWDLVRVSSLVVCLLVHWVKYPDIMFTVGAWLQLLLLILWSCNGWFSCCLEVWNYHCVEVWAGLLAVDASVAEDDGAEVMMLVCCLRWKSIGFGSELVDGVVSSKTL